MKTRHGFTLVELVMVIVIIGLLAAVVIPKFGDMKTEAQNAAESGAVSAIRSGIKLAHMTGLAKGNDTYPTTLDSAQVADASETNPLFTDGNWTKTGNATYQYKPTGNKYQYDASTGKFSLASS
jgi:prepilin-type N-terminal cleavage/methylation domain-containing protein